MGRAIALRDDYSAGDLRRLAKASKDADQSRRLLARNITRKLPTKVGRSRRSNISISP